MAKLSAKEVKRLCLNPVWDAEFRYLSKQYGEQVGLNYLIVVSGDKINAPRGRGAKKTA